MAQYLELVNIYPDKDLYFSHTKYTNKGSIKSKLGLSIKILETFIFWKYIEFYELAHR